MEAGLKKLETQEQKYSAELDKALDEYAELKAQAADFDPVELYEARQAIRPAQEKAAEQQLEDALQKKPSSQFAAERQAGNIPTAQRGHRRAAGTADAYSSATVRPAKAQALPALSDKNAHFPY